MTRFFMTLDEALDLITYAFAKGEHGSIYVKKCDTVEIKDVASVIKSKFNSNSKLLILDKTWRKNLRNINFR